MIAIPRTVRTPIRGTGQAVITDIARWDISWDLKIWFLNLAVLCPITWWLKAAHGAKAAGGAR